VHVIIPHNENPITEERYRMRFLMSLSDAMIPYEELYWTPLKTINKSCKPSRLGGGSECNIFIVEIKDFNLLSAIAERLKSFISPKPLHKAKCIFLNFHEVSKSITQSNEFSKKPSLLNNAALRKIPYKMEIFSTLSHNKGYPRTLLFAYCELCPASKREGRAATGYQLIGAFGTNTGYLQYNPIFPEPSKDFRQSPIAILFADVLGVVSNKLILHHGGPSSISLKHTNLTQSIVHIQQALKQAKEKRIKFIRDQTQAQRTPSQRTVFAILDSLNLRHDVNRSLVLGNGKSSMNISEMSSTLGNELLSLAVNFRHDEVHGHESELLQRSQWYRAKKGIFVYRPLRIGLADHIQHTFCIWLFVFSFCGFVSGIFLSLGRKWDLFSRYRLPHPVDRDTWRYHSRKLSL
jgi:hypothetical protein